MNFLSGLWAKQQANSASNSIRESLNSLGPTEGDKSKTDRANARKDAAAELERKKAERAERKAKLTEQWAQNKAGGGGGGR